MGRQLRRSLVPLRPSALCLLPFFFLLLSACASVAPPAPPPSLAAKIDPLVDAARFARATWFVRVEDDAGHVLYDRNGEKLAVPASNRKLFAATTVANCTPLDSRLDTEIWRDGDDLVVRGDGDPSLGSWRYERDGDFDTLAASLRARGLTTVHDVVADVSRFDRVTIPPSWKVNYLGDAYGAPVDALAWNENTIGPKPVADPALNTATALREALVLAGVNVTGVARVNTAARAWQEKLADIPSPFVAQLLSTVLKNSQNLYAEMLFKRTGDGTYEDALAREHAVVSAEVHADPTSFRFVDGCGLSPDDLVTPAAMIHVLRWMNDPSRRGVWWMILATPGEEGTLHFRLETLHDRMRGKTGTLSGVNALSGFVAMPGGGYRYFSIVVNHNAGDGDATAVIDSIVAAISG